MQAQFRQIEAIRNPMAGALANACFRKRVVKPAKGKGSFSRKAKHRVRDFG